MKDNFNVINEILINISWHLTLVQYTAPWDEAWNEINPLYKFVADYPRFFELFLSIQPDC